MVKFGPTWYSCTGVVEGSMGLAGTAGHRLASTGGDSSILAFCFLIWLWNRSITQHHFNLYRRKSSFFICNKSWGMSFQNDFLKLLLSNVERKLLNKDWLSAFMSWDWSFTIWSSLITKPFLFTVLILKTGFASQSKLFVLSCCQPLTLFLFRKPNRVGGFSLFSLWITVESYSLSNELNGEFIILTTSVDWPDFAK